MNWLLFSLLGVGYLAFMTWFGGWSVRFWRRYDERRQGKG